MAPKFLATTSHLVVEPFLADMNVEDKHTSNKEINVIFY